MENKNEKRTFTRLPSEENEFSYDVRTRMTFRVNKSDQDHLFSGAVKNISAEGICFVSNKRLDRGDKLEILVSLPGAQKPIKMDGEARWCAVSNSTSNMSRFDTGVRIFTVENSPVSSSVYFDEIYHVHWSIVLESVLGRYRIMQQKLREQRD